MSVVRTSRLRIEKHAGPHRTAHIEHFSEPIHFGTTTASSGSTRRSTGGRSPARSTRPPSITLSPGSLAD
jgi:hypothetical protein